MRNDFNEVFANNLKKYMEVNNVTQRALADELCVNASSVSYWMRGIKVPRADKVDKICEIFNCKRSDLIQDSVDSEEPMSKTARKHLENYSQLSPEWQKTIDDLIETLQAESPDSDTLLEVIRKLTTSLPS